MNFSHFFIRRPIFAGVLSIITVVLGLVALLTLPISQYPEVTPPTVFVMANYPGASAETVASTVATPLEQEINGVEDMLYMSSACGSDGQLRLGVTFKTGTDLNMAQVQVQNRVSTALPRLPEEVRRLGVTTMKRAPSITLMINLISPSGKYDDLYMGNYAFLHVKDRLARLPGVGDVRIFGVSEYSMRIWIDPNKASSRNLAAAEIVSAIREQNVQVAAGVFGQSPQPADNLFQLTAQTKGRFSTPEEFGEVILKTDADGQVTRLRDVARIELGANDYNLRDYLDGQPSAVVAIFQLPGSNAVETRDAVADTMKDMAKDFPPGLEYRIHFDTTEFIRESIYAVVKTLIEAMILVVIVVVLFLQNWRASLIPLLAVPVSLIGTFAAMALMGFSLNNLSLFGLVLAIGIVVDDAIVVVENVERNIALGLPPVDATHKAMTEVSSAVIAIGLVLAAVFIPTAFLSGLTGQFYRQFALTIAISTLISAFNSLTLSPALAALLLRPHHEEKDFIGKLLHYSVGLIFTGFNRVFDASRNGYVAALGRLLRHCGVGLVIYAGLLVLTWHGFQNVPVGFVPPQDKGYLIAFVQLPDGASIQRTKVVADHMAQIMRKTPGVGHVIEIVGLSFVTLGNQANTSSFFITLEPFAERVKHGRTGDKIVADLRTKFASIQDGFIGVFGPPPVDGLGMVGGFKLQVQDRNEAGFPALQAATYQLMGAASQDKRISGAISTFRANVPQVFLDVDRAKAKMMHVPLNNVWDTLQIYLGSLYVNDFNAFGRPYRVTAQADAPFRVKAADVINLKTRNEAGDMVPLGTVVKVRDVSAPVSVNRYNMYNAAEITGAPAPGVSTGDAIKIMDDLAKKILPPGMRIEWTEISLLQIMAGNTAVFIFPFCVLMVFLVLAAQYESWSLPLAIILIVPMCLLFAILGIWARGLDNNLFTQIGLVALMGLACKNAILIVEFAKQIQDTGKNRIEAAIEASRLRLRPILMTSLAFAFGVLPMMLSAGAGAEMRRSIGTAVFWGMLGVTFFGIFLTPVFYVVIRAVLERRKKTLNKSPHAHGAAALLITGLLLGSLLTGCAVGPNHQEPETKTNAAFGNAVQPNVATNQTAITWWRSFNDPKLNVLIDQALIANHDLRIATDRVREARALRTVTLLNLAPIVHADASYTRSQSSADSLPMPIERDQRQLGLYNGGFDATWELDIFGRLRRSVEASTAEVATAEAKRRDVLVTLTAELARNYFELRGAQHQLSVVRRNAETQSETLELTLSKLRAGRATELDAARARTQLNATLAIVPPFEVAVKHAIHRIGVLTGRQPTDLEADLIKAAPLPTLPALVNIGSPSELLRRRSDIRAAERALATATALIGVQTADLFPRVTFNGNIALESSQISGLAKAGADTYSFGPRISWAALDLGRVRARIKAARAHADAELAFYEKTVLLALEETENALVSFSQERARRDYLGASERDAGKAFLLARQRYDGGVSDFLAVLDAERTQLEIQAQLAQSETRTATALVAIYKSLGGGWEIEIPPAKPPSN
ncbi:MAG: multidrug efflux RND transporter permease subunit [Verrucomicrobia bacterium]|nr:multidrug efflux RND transporter permease subunit [Verrucomicrobiota bacterium]